MLIFASERIGAGITYSFLIAFTVATSGREVADRSRGDGDGA